MFAIHVQHGDEFLAGEPNHFVKGDLVGDDIDSLILDFLLVKPVLRFVAPPTIGLDEQSNPFWFHSPIVAEIGGIIKCALGIGKGRGREIIAKRQVWEGERPREPKHVLGSLETRACEDARPPWFGQRALPSSATQEWNHAPPICAWYCSGVSRAFNSAGVESLIL